MTSVIFNFSFITCIMYISVDKNGMKTTMDMSNPSATIKCWVDLYMDNLFSWALHKTNNKEIAEDLVQETFLTAFKSLGQFEGRSEPKTWLFAILNNKIAEHYRKAFKQITVSESQTSYYNLSSFFDNFFDTDDHWRQEQQPKEWSEEEINLLDDQEFNQTLQNCMQNLPENWRFALQLKYLDERKGELICQELQITPSNFWQILHRAKLQLRNCLEINWFKKL